MRRHLLWKLILNIIPVIALTILVVWLAIDNLAATYFMRLMENYAINPTDSHQMFIESVHRYLVWAALASLVLALLLSFLMTRRVLRPLSQMTRISRELAAGNFSNRVEVVTQDEVGQLGEAFNSMAESLESLEKLRKGMVSDLAHELRTPLTNLRGYLEGLSDGVVEPSVETFKMLEGEILHLVHLVDDLQQLTKADAAKAFLRRKNLSVKEVLRQIMPLFEQRYAARRLHLEVKVTPPEQRITADLDKLLQALRNLLENALAYTPDGGRVQLLARQVKDSVEIAVINSGPGIDAEDLPYIFERFYRADRARSRRQGAGIGLSIVKQLVEAHGGSVGAESGDGQTRIWLRLPNAEQA